MIDLTRATVVNDEVLAEVENLMTYHRWDEEKVKRGEQVRSAIGSAILSLIANVPPCPTRTRAINHLIDARMVANAAITHNGRY